MHHGDIEGHMHLRERARTPHAVHYAYPSSNRAVRFFDRLMYVAGTVGPLVALPQLIEIYGHHNADGIAVSTWVGYVLLTLLWLIYGVIHRERPIIITQSLWLVINVLIVIGAIVY